MKEITTKSQALENLLTLPKRHAENKSNIFKNKTNFKIKVLSPLVAYSGPAEATDDDEQLAELGIDSRYIFKGRILDSRMAHASFLNDPCDLSIAGGDASETVAALHSNVVLSKAGGLPNIQVGDIVYGELEPGDNDNPYNLQFIHMTSVSDVFQIQSPEAKIEKCYDLKLSFETSWTGDLNGGFEAGPPTDISPYGLRHGDERNPDNITQIGIHYSVSVDLDGAIVALAKQGYSYNFIIDQAGTPHFIIDPRYEAFHAGGANKKSIGISFINMGYDEEGAAAYNYPTDNWISSGEYRWEPYTEAAINTAVALVQGFQVQFPNLSQIWGHEDGNGNKSDPGPAFDQYYPRFYALGLNRGPYRESTRNRTSSGGDASVPVPPSGQ